ncbi:hypothetical protein [Raoultella ornithinolytica]|uniref:hypothetical protein n=1 Tax=Raoultella ornithinolytica TaxID=54291 RepID=UPI0013974197|nr:hypothetical protein [Raoultella ornithinolytica]QHW68653.1 hypothetical protein GZS10_12825 [Raoultella ornithinolytica]
MIERGMIFNGEMVRAILDGRKTQTRRIMAPQPADDIERSAFPNPDAIGWKSSLKHKYGSTTAHFFPFGAIGDRIWVRETFRVHSRATDVATLVYKASERNSWTEQTHRVPVAVCNKPATPEKWTPSLHMPRWASRILLEITDVRVERLKNISDGDAIREGCSVTDMKSGDCVADVFARLWESIYGEESWKANPWVWVIEFKRVEGGAA